MITNERQYRITRRWLERFEQARAGVEEQGASSILGRGRRCAINTTARSRNCVRSSRSTRHCAVVTSNMASRDAAREAIVNEIIFLVEEAAEGGFIARALGQSIFTEADDLAALREQVRDAVRCHFEEEQGPRVIRLHFVREEVLTV